MTTEDSAKAMEEVKIGDAVQEEQEDVVDPWNVQSSSDKGVDYDKLISKIFLLIFDSLIHYLSFVFIVNSLVKGAIQY